MKNTILKCFVVSLLFAMGVIATSCKKDVILISGEPVGDGVIIGKFTVNRNGGCVYFSQGNLQYQVSTGEWRFAEHQYDYIGEANNNISSSYNGWIDLFGWGTSGYKGKYPYMTSTKPNDYGNGESSIGGTNYDWGVYNKITNGGDQAGLWRTLTSHEWNYLLTERNDAYSKCGKGKVNGVCGMILLPDSWTLPSGLSFTAGTYTWNNSYTTEQWTQMEGNGAVFLPAAGYRCGTSVYEEGSYGNYWSASYNDENYVHDVEFDDWDLDSFVCNDRYYGQSVRLVRSTLKSDIPTVTTLAVDNISFKSAEGGGNVTLSGGLAVTERGLCWSTSHNPTVSDSHANNGTSTGSFSVTMTGLEPSTIYYVRAYAVNDNGTAYGNEMSFTTTDSLVFLEGAIKGLFSVSADAQVYFSQGNLQYKASTNTWRFAENQYDYVGEANSNISSFYSGWIDLFGWGTSGWNSGANCYQPWSTSQTYSDYYPGGSMANSLTGNFANADWGVYNRITNGGNQAGLWRTLTNAEWVYVFETRNTTSGIRFAKAQVNGKNGVILVPDDWSATIYELNSTNIGYEGGAYYTDNIIDSFQWVTLEEHGAVFLPTAGYRNRTTIGDLGSSGYYWSASCGDEYHGCCICFMPHYVLPSGYYDAVYSYGQSVRLVHTAQ